MVTLFQCGIARLVRVRRYPWPKEVYFEHWSSVCTCPPQKIDLLKLPDVVILNNAGTCKQAQKSTNASAQKSTKGEKRVQTSTEEPLRIKVVNNQLCGICCGQTESTDAFMISQLVVEVQLHVKIVSK